MFRILIVGIWLILTAWLAIWVGEGLFGIDQSTSILPLNSPGSPTAPIMVGVAWGIILTFGSTLFARGARSRVRGETEIGVGRVVEASRTGLTVNDVPQFDIFLRVTAADGTEFVGRLRRLVGEEDAVALRPGTPLPVRFSLIDRDVVETVDPTDPDARAALLDWRIQRGLIDPRQVRARREGTQEPASVLSVRPTGVRREGQSELDIRVLVTPDGRPSWEADTTVFVYPEALSRVQVGSPVWVRYLASDPRTVALTIEEEV